MERRVVICVQVREMESKLKQYGVSEMTTNPQDFISRKDHARICDSRVSAREADLQVSWGCPPTAPYWPSSLHTVTNRCDLFRLLPIQCCGLVWTRLDLPM